jgi:hypothetical protein
MTAFLGIAREPVFSPNKVDADRAILEAVANVLRARGHRVAVTDADRLPRRPARGTTVFTMAQGPEALGLLKEWEQEGFRVVNSADAVLNCHRHRMCERLEHAEVGIPETIILSTAAPAPRPEWLDLDGGWLKRGDVHATAAGDVRFVADRAAVTAGAGELAARGIPWAVLQRHVAGPLLKFYAVADAFLVWYPMRATPVSLAPAQANGLRTIAGRAARALGLEVFGGDIVVGPEALRLIDLNDWPSYRPCQPAAAKAIASRLEAHSEASTGHA